MSRIPCRQVNSRLGSNNSNPLVYAIVEMSLDLSIVIVTFNDRENLRRCLNSIKESAGNLSLQVIIYDNSSSDGTLAMLKEFPGIKVIEGPDNIGVPRALNRAARLAEAPLLLSLDSDTIVSHGALTRLIAFMVSREDVAVAGARLYYENGQLQASARRFPAAINGIFGRHSLLTRWFPENPISRKYLMNWMDDAVEPFFPEWVSAACMVIRKTAFDALGGFDERFFLYWSDADFCYRAGKAGHKIACVPGAKVIHCEQYKPRGRKNPRMILDFHKGVYKFYSMHSASDAFHPMRWIAFFGLSLRCGLLLLLNQLKEKSGKYQVQSQVTD